MSEWREVKLGELCDFQKGYAFKSIDYQEYGRNIVKVSNLNNYNVDLSNCVCIDDIKVDKYTQYELRKDDVIITTVGSWPSNPNSVVGKVVKVQKEAEKSLLNQNAVRVRALTDINQKYLFYTLKYKEFFDYIVGTAQGAANQASITQNDIKNYTFFIPPLEEQKAIADTLSCLDEKIELNNRMNKTLEEMAQAIFKSWFVDFEPFQDGEFEDSEMGMIPKGWRVGKLEEIIELFDSRRIPLSSRKRENMKKIYPYYGATSLMDYVENYIFDGCYILLGEDGTVVDANGYPILQYVWGKFWVNNHAHILKGKNGFNEESIYMLLKNTNVQGIVTGAVQLKINQANLKSIKVIIPKSEEIKKYNYLLEPLFAQKRIVLDKNQKLAAIRDKLLPKLMSGEIRVPIEEAE